MAIACNAELSNRAHVRVLPHSWGTLYELSRLDPEGLKVAFDEHWITPEMERKDVKDLRIRLGIDDEARGGNLCRLRAMQNYQKSHMCDFCLTRGGSCYRR
jgi:hypothetical protein